MLSYDARELESMEGMSERGAAAGANGLGAAGPPMEEGKREGEKCNERGGDAKQEKERCEGTGLRLLHVAVLLVVSCLFSNKCYEGDC